MTALVLTAVLTAAPTLPIPSGVDHDASYRGVLVEQILEHREYTDHIRAVWRHRRQEAAAAVVSVPEPTTAYSGDMGWADELRAVGFPESAIPTMLYIIDRESGGDPNAVNGGGAAYAGGPACGLAQLWPCPGPQALDPITNLRYAYQKYQASGFSPWAMS
jgi:hypothetical protein